MSGLFITFEGGEGSGKTTQIQLLVSWLKDSVPGCEIVITREPGGTPVAEGIRNILVTGTADKLLPGTEALLMSASRHEHVERVIKPALAAGKIVISDRYNDSTTVYQGIVGGVARPSIDALHHLACGDVVPDATLLLDLDADVGLGRADDRGGAETRFETKGKAFHQSVRKGFLSLAGAEPNRFHIIDANRSIEEIAHDVSNAIAPLLGRVT